jgi:hypothetical protein
MVLKRAHDPSLKVIFLPKLSSRSYLFIAETANVGITVERTGRRDPRPPRAPLPWLLTSIPERA